MDFLALVAPGRAAPASALVVASVSHNPKRGDSAAISHVRKRGRPPKQDAVKRRIRGNNGALGHMLKAGECMIL